MAVLVLQNKHTQPTQLPFLWSEPPADHAYWDRFKIVLLRWTSAFLGTCFGFISLFKNQEYMTTSGTERLSNAILDFPLAHESVLNTINYWIHRGFFWKAALTLFYIISRFDTLWRLVINLCLSTWRSNVLLVETRQQFPDWSSQITRKQEWQLIKPVQRTLMSYLQPVSSFSLEDGTSSQRQSFQARHHPSTAGSPRPAAYTTPTRK